MMYVGGREWLVVTTLPPPGRTPSFRGLVAQQLRCVG
jgi:hypothetical protein